MARIYFFTQGCSANVADSEVMQGLLSEAGHEIVYDEKHADLIVLNSCTVKGPTESAFIKKLSEIKEKNPDKKIIIAGCIPQSQLKDYSDYSRIGTYQIKRIVEAVEETLKGKIISFLDRKDEGRLNLPKIRKNELIEIVPISQGCLNSCTYCKTKHARGELNSYLVKDIVRHISKAVDNGAKEIWLTSQDNACYGSDIGTNLANLLKSTLTIKKDFKIRIGMGNPQHFVSYLNELIELMKDKRVFKFIHIPLQSGSDKVLKDMNREYKVSDFVKVVSKFKKIPNISVMTDIIVAYPTESEKDFEETVKIIKKLKIDMINYSRFWPRPGTPAAKLKLVDGAEARDRTSVIMNLFKKLGLEHNKQFIGKEQKILITEKGKNGTFIGKNDSYKQVVVKGNYKLGQEVNVKIKEASAVDLKG
ncbi:tRNA (N(6)-L-threonylcarbamoyladenosine(37)-C(2))-methylthiotransferase [Candidatus Woesearchaeota archaeon]|nr:tRNA (N(6)-L-threonylcarbamoyladenosine(37)-C(2))-methylthiotransferase [Candidatus Woesearchaeota archaeon]